MRKASPILLCGLIAGLLIWAGAIQLFHRFMLYDDEGYVLVSLKNFSLHGSLYHHVYSQYGPAFYLIYDALHRLLGFAWTNTSGRWITLFNWAGTAVFCAVLVRRARGSWPLVICVLAESFRFLWVMASEPMHPGSTITLIVAATAWLGWEMLQTGRSNAFAVVTAALGAVLALIKINVGVFLLLSSAFWLMLSTLPARSSRRQLLLGLLGGLLPLILMRTRIHEVWAQIFAVVAAFSIMGVTIAVVPAAQRQPAGPRAWRLFCGTGLAVAALTSCLMLTRGTSLSELWQGVVIGPLSHPGAYAFGPPWLPGSVGLAGVMAGLLLFARSRPGDSRLVLLLAWLRVVAATAYVLCAVWSMDDRHGVHGLSYGVPLAGLFAWPLDRKNPASGPADQARGWLALLLVFQCLHAYPVAGSQLNWGTFLWVPLMALGFEDALRVVSTPFAPGFAVTMRRGSPLVLTLLAAYGTITFFGVSLTLLDRYGDEPLAQPGAEQIYMPANYSSSLRILAENARVHGDVLFSLPGCYSFNLWTGVDTPTLANATHWFSLLDDGQQQEIIRRLDTAERPVFIFQETVLADVMQTGVQPKGPLWDYLFASFQRSFAIESYSFWIRNDRSVAALSTGILTPAPGEQSGLLQLQLTVGPQTQPLGRVEFWSTAGTNERFLTLDATQTDVVLTPLHLDGTAAGSPQPAAWPWSIDRVSRVTLTFTPPFPLPPEDTIEILFVNEAGAYTGSARIISNAGLELPLGPPMSPATAP